jgi:hypothetical protein
MIDQFAAELLAKSGQKALKGNDIGNNPTMGPDDAARYFNKGRTLSNSRKI